jgi:lysophospholipase L1-like esterase
MLASVVAVFGALEIGLRVGGFIHYPARVPPIIWNAEEDRLLKGGEGLHEIDAHQLWRPRPGAQTPWGVDDRINARGYRGEELALERTPGVARIATLGDSSTFGMGIEAQSHWTPKLARAIAANGTRCEALCAGVIGFTIEQGLQRYRALVRSHRPDVVVAAFGAVNEHFAALGEPDREKIARSSSVGPLQRFGLWSRNEIRVLHFFGWIVDTARGEDRVAMRKALNQKKKEQAELAEKMGPIGALDYPGQRRVSLERFREDLRELARLVREDGGRLVLISMPRFPELEAAEPILEKYNEAVLTEAAALGVPCYDARTAVKSELAKGTKWEELFIDSYHPSIEGHELIAQGVAPLVMAELQAGAGSH